MNDTISRTLTPHSDRWINASYGYVAEVTNELAPFVEVLDGWIDPSGPRDATIRYRRSGAEAVEALVWDEESGWRYGEFIAGEQGERTALADPAHLGGGLLPEPAEVRRRLLAGVSEPRRRYRSHADLTDGFDALLETYGVKAF